MDKDNKHLRPLNDLFTEFTNLSFPRTSIELENIGDLLGDIQVELADEDGYLAGLVDAFLHTKKLNVKEISVNSSIDSRIEEVLRIAQRCCEDVIKLKGYRHKMIELANALSLASGVPIRKQKNLAIK